MSDGEGFLYRFPDHDFELGFTDHVPAVGETLRARGAMWTVVQVTRGSDNRAVVNLAPMEPIGEESEPFMPE